MSRLKAATHKYRHAVTAHGIPTKVAHITRRLPEGGRYKIKGRRDDTGTKI